MSDIRPFQCYLFKSDYLVPNKWLTIVGHADCYSIFLSEIAKMYTSFTAPVDVAIVSVTPPDQFGYCSMGVSIDCTSSAVRAAKKIIGNSLSRK